MTLTRTGFKRSPRPVGILGQASHQAIAKKVKPRRCAHCRQPFEPSPPGARVCSGDCAEGLVRAANAKAGRVAAKAVRAGDKVRKAALKGLRDWIAETQVAFNAWVRERDRLAGHACISSGKPLDWSGNNVDAGHYRSRGSAPHLRFDERNCHAQSKQENRYASGNATDYRIGLIARIGLQAVEELECDNAARKFTIEELKGIKAHYKAKLKAMGCKFPAPIAVIEDWPLDDEFDRMTEEIDDL